MSRLSLSKGVNAVTRFLNEGFKIGVYFDGPSHKHQPRVLYFHDSTVSAKANVTLQHFNASFTCEDFYEVFLMCLLKNIDHSFLLQPGAPFPELLDGNTPVVTI